MAKLNTPNVRFFNRKDLEKYPLWVWDDGNEGHLPISDGKYISEYGTLFIKAVFECENHVFEGYVVGFDFFYAFSLFVNEKKFAFNINLNSFIYKTILDIFQELKCQPFNIFPLKYTSPISFEDGSPISGEFILKNGELSCIPDSKIG